MSALLLQPTVASRPLLSLVPRYYQTEARNNAIDQWQNGIRGILWRAATGSGKTVISCMAMDEWLSMGPTRKCMVLSYERQLVWQFAQEIEDFMHVTPGIEMGNESINAHNVPRIVVASRQTLLQIPLATQEQIAMLTEAGIDDVGLCTMSLARTILDGLQKGISVDDAKAIIAEHNAKPECAHDMKAVSRLHKFDWRDDWLLICDEAHKYAMRLRSCGHLVEWFERNPNHRRAGQTGTPKRFDGVSIGDKLFPGIALDYPLVSLTGHSAIADGYAVPYVQKYIAVEGVDFRSLRQIAGDYDESQLEAILSEEKILASLCEPLLDLVENRRTIIFSPGVEMAKLVAAYINARVECQCPTCGKIGWHPRPMVADGATCKYCNTSIDSQHVTKPDSQANYVTGSMSKLARQEIYRQHKSGKIQFLSVCGLCKEGYNDPPISCVAVFRPVSRKASSLAEQMKGRGCRPLSGLVEGVNDREERLRLIRESEKPDCLIVDLTGVSGLPDCSTTAQLYAEGLDDEIVTRAEEHQLSGGIPNVEDAVRKAVDEITEEREQAKREREEKELAYREEAERRSKAGAEVRYSTHDIGHGSSAGNIKGNASEKQVKFLNFLGIKLVGWWPSMKQAGRMIDQLTHGEEVKIVVYTNGIKSDNWEPSKPSIAQLRLLSRYGINGQELTPKQASDEISRLKNGTHDEPTGRSIHEQILQDIASAQGHGQLNLIARRVVSARHSGELSDRQYQDIVAAGKLVREKVF